MSFQHFDLTTSEQKFAGVRNVVSVDDDGTLVTRDIQDSKTLQVILDANAQARNEFTLDTGKRAAYGYLAARIPVVIWHNWRKEWRMKHADKWTWQTFEAMKLNSRDYSYLRTTDSKIGVPLNVANTG